MTGEHNQWTLPALAGIKDPEMCSISSSKLQKLTKSKHLQDLYRVMYNGQYTNKLKSTLCCVYLGKITQLIQFHDRGACSSEFGMPPCRKEKHDSIGYVETPNNLSKSEEELLVS
jgi:hypothetical protein